MDEIIDTNPKLHRQKMYVFRRIDIKSFQFVIVVDELCEIWNISMGMRRVY